MYRGMRRHFNTSYVEVYLSRSAGSAAGNGNFNTSYVEVYPIFSFQGAVHLLYFNTSYVEVYRSYIRSL